MSEPSYDANDCEIFALLGRELLDWGKTAPDVSQFKIFYRPGRDGFVQQCPWAKMGVTPLPPGRPSEDNVRYFTQPMYDDARTSAAVSLVTSLVVRDARGKPRPAHINQLNLKLKKIDERWVLISKEQGPMT
jgi:hypothetical protein